MYPEVDNTSRHVQDFEFEGKKWAADKIDRIEKDGCNAFGLSSPVCLVCRLFSYFVGPHTFFKRIFMIFS